MTRRTRALVLEDFGHLKVHHVDTPGPQPDELTVRVTATGICGSDLHGYTGENGRRRPGQIMGHETAGVVESLGNDVEGLAIGDRVTINPVMIPLSDRVEFAGREQHSPRRVVLGVQPDRAAAFADRVTVPAANVVRLDESLPTEFGALIEPLAVAVHAVRRSGGVAGKNVLVLGGGPIGQSLVLALQEADATRVFVSELDPARRDLCAALGAEPIDPRTLPLSERLVAWSGRVADIAFDAVGISQTLRDACSATAFGATVCLVGMGEPQLTLDAYQVSTEERSIVGSFCYSDDNFRNAAALAAKQRDRLSLLISERVSPDNADAAFQRLLRPSGAPGKVLVRFDA